MGRGRPIPGVCYFDRGTQLPSLREAIECPTEVDMTRVLAIDDLDGLLRSADAETLQRLAYLIRERRTNTHVLLVGSSAAFAASYDGMGQAIKELQTGFIVGGSDYEDLQVLGIAVPHAEASQGLPPGRAFNARRKRYVRLKVADPC